MERKIYSADDATRDDKGRWSIEFMCPINGPRAISGLHPTMMARSVNDLLESAFRAKDAIDPYRKGVQALVEMALEHKTSSAAAAAQVLLSGYNSDFQLKITDLCALDQRNFEHAIAVIRGRAQCFKEPQTMIENGDEIFELLWGKWKHLHVSQRYKDYYE